MRPSSRSPRQLLLGNTATSSAPAGYTTVSWPECATISQGQVGGGAMPSTLATPRLAIALTFTLTSSPWPAALGSRRALRSALLFQQTRTKELSRVTIAGRNSSPTDAGCRWTSVRRGRIRSWPTTTSVTTQRTASSWPEAAILSLSLRPRRARSTSSSIRCSKWMARELSPRQPLPFDAFTPETCRVIQKVRAKTNRPFVSIIVPVLNESALIRGFLQHLRATAPSAEIIVVDGGSVDGTVELCAGWADRVLLAPRGRGRQMNAGAAVARAEVLWFVHA